MQIKKSDLNQALEILAADANVFVPGEIENVTRFVLWENGMEVNLTGENTTLPPKDILFPCTEKMYNYKMGKSIEIKEIVSKPKQVIFGVRPCDMRSIDCMDRVFLEKGYVDSFYSRKRENVTLFAMGCTRVSRTCFCDSMGLDPNDAPNADVMMHDAGDAIVMEAYTEKGEQALKSLDSLLAEGTAQPAEPVSCDLNIPVTDDLPEKLGRMFEHSIWDEVTRACIGCATCTYVCPTCYCFDIDSDNHGTEGTKYRCWDSCMFSDYSRMAGGHNPRPTKKERVRNRYMHKLSFFHDRYGQLLCVGCGRCIEKCPAHMDISAFIEKAAEVEINE